MDAEAEEGALPRAAQNRYDAYWRRREMRSIRAIGIREPKVGSADAGAPAEAWLVVATFLDSMTPGGGNPEPV